MTPSNVVISSYPIQLSWKGVFCIFIECIYWSFSIIKNFFLTQSNYRNPVSGHDCPAISYMDIQWEDSSYLVNTTFLQKQHLAYLSTYIFYIYHNILTPPTVHTHTHQHPHIYANHTLIQKNKVAGKDYKGITDSTHTVTLKSFTGPFDFIGKL